MTSRGRWLAVVAIALMSPASSGWGQTVEQTGNSSCRACSAAERSRCICTQGNAADNGSPPSAARGIPTVRGANLQPQLVLRRSLEASNQGRQSSGTNHIACNAGSLGAR